VKTEGPLTIRGAREGSVARYDDGVVLLLRAV